MGGYIGRFLDYFLGLGIKKDEPDISKRAYIQYFNFDLMGYMGFAVLTIPIVFLLPAEIRPFLHIMGTIYVAVIAVCFYLNSKGHHIISSVIINTALLFAVAVTDIRIGSESHLHFFLVTVCITPLFFLRDRKWLAYLMMAMSFALFLILSEGVTDLPHSLYRSPDIIPFFRTLVNITVIPLTTLRFLYIFKVNDRYLTEISDQRQYLRRIIDLNPSFIFAKNREGQFTMANKAVAKAYGTTVDGLIGKTDSDFNPNMDEVLHFRKDDIEVMDKQHIKYVPVEVITDATGRKRYLQTVKTPIIEETGTANQILGVSTDITERIQTQQAMEQMRDALSHKNRELERYIDSNLQLENFAYIASHDLREPLRSIIGYSQLLERRYGDLLDEEGKQFISHLISSTKNMNMLITDLLLYSRVNTDAIKHQVVHMSEIRAQVMDNLKVMVRESQAIVTWHDMPVAITADKSRLIQLFQNLIANGIKFRTAGKEPLVDIYYRMVGGHHEFEVRDNGIGIDPKFHERIFHIFHRLHNRLQYEGSGIGLATCTKIVEQHRGTIRVISAIGSGSAFIFTIGSFE
ncbi:MAG: sensor signal transduction histidine kinase [Bacteroidetes bacterium]|nr:sensor signal transduction histidine kinase [Bacteroidota bacterium]